MDKITKSKIVLRIMLKPLDPLSKKREDAERKSKGKEEGEIIKRARDLVKMGSLEENVILLFYRELLSFSDKNLREKKEAASMMRKKLIDIIFNSYFLSFAGKKGTFNTTLDFQDDFCDIEKNLDLDFAYTFEFFDREFKNIVMKKEINSCGINYEDIKNIVDEQEVEVDENETYNENDYWKAISELASSEIFKKIEIDNNKSFANNNYYRNRIINNREEFQYYIANKFLKIIESNNEKFTRFLVNKHPKILVIANLFSKKEIKKTIESFIYLRNLNIDEEYMFSGVFDKVSHLEKILDRNI